MFAGGAEIKDIIVGTLSCVAIKKRHYKKNRKLTKKKIPPKTPKQTQTILKGSKM